jgi:hypothetical protein
MSFTKFVDWPDLFGKKHRSAMGMSLRHRSCTTTDNEIMETSNRTSTAVLWSFFSALQNAWAHEIYCIGISLSIYAKVDPKAFRAKC